MNRLNFLNMHFPSQQLFFFQLPNTDSSFHDCKLPSEWFQNHSPVKRNS